jgi:hypothetical protein
MSFCLQSYDSKSTFRFQGHILIEMTIFKKLSEHEPHGTEPDSTNQNIVCKENSEAIFSIKDKEILNN